MKFSRLILAIFTLVLLSTGISQAAEFEYTGGSNEEMYFFRDASLTTMPTIGGRALETNDEIGLFAIRDGVAYCFGGTVVDEINDINNLIAYGYQPAAYGVPAKPGFNDNETIYLRIYDSSEDVIYEDVEFTAVEAFTDPAVTWNQQYVALGSVVFLSINAIAPPRAPGNLAPADGSVGVALTGNMTWEDISDYADSYELQIATDAAGTTLIEDETGINTNSYAYSFPNNGTSYWWRVRGNLTGKGGGDWSAWQQVTTVLATPALTSPANNSLGFAMAGTLDWEASTGAATYDWEVYTDAGTTLLTSGNTADTEIENAANGWGLVNGTDYWWRVQAKNGANVSAWTSLWKFTTQIGAVTLNTPANNATKVAFPAPLTWNTLAGASSYEIQVANNNMFTTGLISTTSATTNKSISGLASWTPYFWRVRGIDANSNPGEWSTVWSFTTDLTAPMNPNPANNFVGVQLGGDLTWDAVNGATSYDVVIATDANLNNIVDQGNVASASFAFGGLAYDTKYYWNVTAKNATSTKASATWNFRTRLDSPTLLTPVSGSTCNGTSLTLDWADFSADYYNLMVASDAAFTNIVGGFDGTAQITAHEQVITGLSNGTTYWWKVQAYKSGQLSGYSPENSFTTEYSEVIPLTPANFTKGVARTNVSATWQAQTGATSYTFEYADNSAFTGSTTVNTANTTATIAGPLAYNTTYYWRVYSDLCGADDAEDATVREFTTLLPAPSLTSPADGATEVALSGTLTWGAVAGAENYTVQMSTFEDFSDDVHINTTANSNSYNYSSIEHNITHYWRVRANDDGEPGEWSDTYEFTTVQLGPPTLTVPANGYHGTLFSVQLFWNVYPDAVSYNVQASTDPTFATGILLNTNTTLPTATVSGLTYGQTVYWRAQTVTADEVSNWNNPFSFTTIPAPDITGNNPVCETTSGLYSVQVDNNINYVIDYAWTVTGATLNGDADGTSIDVTFPNDGNATLTVTRSSAQWGAYTDSESFTVTVNPTVNLQATYEVDSYYSDKLCVNEVLTFTAVEAAGKAVEDFEWYLMDGVNATLLSEEPMFDHQFAAAGTYEVELRAYNSTNCGYSEYSMDVVIDETCPVMVTVDDMSACKFTPATFTTTEVWGGDGDYDYYWYPSNTLNNANIAEPTILNLIMNTTYLLQVQDGNDLVGSDYSYVTVNNLPTINTQSLVRINLSDGSFNLTDYITYESADVESTTWKKKGSPDVVVEDPTDVSTNPRGFRRYFVTAENANGCFSNPSYVSVFILPNKQIVAEDVVAGLNGTSVLASYPNPVVSTVNVYAEFIEATDITVKVADLLGNETVIERVSGVSIYEKSIDLSDFTAGMYMIIVESNNDQVIKRIIKQ